MTLKLTINLVFFANILKGKVERKQDSDSLGLGDNLFVPTF